MFRYLTGDVIPVPSDGAKASHNPHHYHNCFGCGPDNAEGLNLSVRFATDFVLAELSFPDRFEGGPGLVHGGAIAAFFDDLMGFVPLAHNAPGVTAKLDINYLKPIPLGVTLLGKAWMANIDGRKMSAEATGETADGTRFIEAHALFIQVGAEHFQKALGYESNKYYP